MAGHLPAVCALILILVALGCSDAKSIKQNTVHLGRCPRPAYANKPHMCDDISFTGCTNDSPCRKFEKCCDNGCGRTCMTAIGVRFNRFG